MFNSCQIPFSFSSDQRVYNIHTYIYISTFLAALLHISQCGLHLSKPGSFEINLNAQALLPFVFLPLNHSYRSCIYKTTCPSGISFLVVPFGNLLEHLFSPHDHLLLEIKFLSFFFWRFLLVYISTSCILPSGLHISTPRSFELNLIDKAISFHLFLSLIIFADPSFFPEQPILLRSSF